MLRSSLLVTAFGALEVLIGVLAREFYLAHPGALGDEPKFTLKELQQFDSLDDARTAAVASQVDKVLKGDLAEWEKWFESRLHLPLDSYCIDRSKLEEMFQRRHVIVHNDSRVSRLYLRRLSVRAGLPELDQILPVPRPYLEDALEALDVLGSLLAFNAWRKLFSGEEAEATEDITRRSYSLMRRGRWAAARKICQACVDAPPKAEHREIFRANHWLAEKRLGNLADVRDEIDIWDVSALHPRFAFVRHALLDDIDAAISLADRLLGQGVIDLGSVEDWPVLQELREHPRYPEMIAKHAPVSDDASGEQPQATADSEIPTRGPAPEKHSG